VLEECRSVREYLSVVHRLVKCHVIRLHSMGRIRIVLLEYEAVEYCFVSVSRIVYVEQRKKGLFQGDGIQI
jgi:hypothetical protein